MVIIRLTVLSSKMIVSSTTMLAMSEYILLTNRIKEGFRQLVAPIGNFLVRLYKGQGRRAASRLQAWLDAKARKDRFSDHKITACLFTSNRYYPDESYAFIACHIEQFDSHPENYLCEKSTDALKPVNLKAC